MADRQDLERVQKAAVKVILGKDYVNYDEALSVLKLESLEKRRETMALKFVKNSLENNNYSKLFPLREVKHDIKIRQSEKYVVNQSRTKRHRDSAVPYLQELLNKDHFKRRKELKSLLDAGRSQSYEQRKRIRQKNRVNYVSNIDVIT